MDQGVREMNGRAYDGDSPEGNPARVGYQRSGQSPSN